MLFKTAKFKNAVAPCYNMLVPPKKRMRPRGPSPGGRKKLPSKGGARRTASIRVSKVLGDLLEGLQEQNISMKPEHLAELQAI